MWLIAPENDYRSILDLQAPDPQLRVTVCMPVYNRVDLLARTVAALAAQSYPRELMSVSIGDDGSDEDVAAAVAPFSGRLDITVSRRERDGYGAGQARNLAARNSAGDILVFVDSDCLPDPDLVLNHAVWHHLAENLVVIGSRHGVDTSGFDLDALARGSAPLRELAFGTAEPGPKQLSQTDYRGVLHRRTADGRHGDEAFRSLVSSNFSIRRDRFFEIGGFDESFHRWGGEDIELGWRCHVAGLFTVPDDRAVCYHQLQEDLWDAGGREDSAKLNAGVIQNKIPHHFYRRYRRGLIRGVPKVSVVVTPEVPARIEELADHFLSQSYADWELIAHGTSPETILFSERTAADPRFRVISSDDPLDSIREARGEIVLVFGGDATPEPSLLRQLVRHLDTKRRDSAVTVGYLVGTTAHRNREDAGEIDDAWGPVCFAARRREWSKVLHDATDFETALAAVKSISKSAHLRQALTAVRSARPGNDVGRALPAFTSPRNLLLRELYDAGPSPAALRVIASRLRDKPGEPVPEPDSAPPVASAPETPTIRYVGWTGKENLGDDALLQAISGVLDWGRVQTSKRGDLLLLGGGTLIGRDPYIDWIEETDSPRIERAVFGTGVANPKFWGSNDDARRWVEWLDTCALIGVRGPFSAQILADWGVHRDVEVIGDAALLLTASAPKRDGLVVISPCRTRGESWGGDDESVVSALVSLARKLTTDGHDVSVLAAHPDDDGMCIRVLSEVPGTTYFAGYRDVGASMEHFASAGLVVAERLHSAVLAAAVGTPFVGIEYRPKVADFATSVGMAGQVLRTDQLGGLEELVIGSLAATDRLVETFSPRVEEYRDRLRRAAADLRDTMRR